MKLKNKYVVGCLVMWYEVEMLPEYVESCIQMMEGIENPENVYFHFCLNHQQYFEKIDHTSAISGNIGWRLLREINRIGTFTHRNFHEFKSNFYYTSKHGPDDNFNHDGFYNIAKYRRDLNHEWCDRVDCVLWGETDSLWPKETLAIIEQVHNAVEKTTPKYVLSFASRVNWDASWDITRHPAFELDVFTDNDEWVLNNEASEKSYMSLERMNEINSAAKELEILELHSPKADGSCLVISSELIKSGVNIPHALLHCGEDESFLRMAKLVMGNNFRQYLVKNILRVHNRRHPKKRMYIKNENNPRGFCDERKGDWWKKLEDGSKFNLENLRNQVKFKKIEEVI